MTFLKISLNLEFFDNLFCLKIIMSNSVEKAFCCCC